jgi:DNA repair protein RadC
MVIELTEEQIASILIKDRAKAYGGKRQKLVEPNAVFEYLRHIGGLNREHCLLLTLDARRQVIAKHEISVGTVDASLVHPREVFRPAILDAASFVIVAHNHPSGDTNPSDEDLVITRRLATAGKILGISVLDHVVIGGDGYYSLQEHHQI